MAFTDNDHHESDHSDGDNMLISPTITDTIDSERSIPSSQLERIGDTKQYIIYSKANDDLFHAWWETTKWAKVNDAKGNRKVNICRTC